MPTYEYLCEANGRVVEVNHKLAEAVRNWGELCQRAEIPVGGTDPRAKVSKLMSASFVSTGNASAMPAACEMPACGTGGCGSELCGIN